MSTDVRHQRNRGFERELTERIVGFVADARALSVFAERRADRAEDEYGQDFPALDRDLEREALEELADCRNYVVWRLDGIHRDLFEGGERVEHLQNALRYVALAFNEVMQARV